MTGDDENGDDGGLRFWLPPIRLPPLFPDDFRWVPPIPGRVPSSGNLLLAAVALDAIDAAVALTVGIHLPRVALGTLLALVLAGPAGLAYAWEVAALAAPAWIAAVPSATLLVLLGD